MSWLPFSFDHQQDDAAENANIANRIIFELGNPDQLHVSNFDGVNTENIVGFIHYSTPKEAFDLATKSSGTNDCFSMYTHAVLIDPVTDWVSKNRELLFAFGAQTKCLSFSTDSGGTLIVRGLKDITAEHESAFLFPMKSKRIFKERSMMLAALDVLYHKALTSEAYHRKDIDSVAVHMSFMHRSLAQFALFSGFEDGRAIRGAFQRGGRPKVGRNALKTLLKKLCPNYLDEDLSFRQVWMAVRSGLGSESDRTPCGGSSFSFQPERTSESPLAGTIVERTSTGKEKPLGFYGLYRVVRSFRELR